jgi:hypothetical protein
MDTLEVLPFMGLQVEALEVRLVQLVLPPIMGGREEVR